MAVYIFLKEEVMEEIEAKNLIREHRVSVEFDSRSYQKIVHELGICLKTELVCVPCTEESVQSIL